MINYLSVRPVYRREISDKLFYMQHKGVVLMLQTSKSMLVFWVVTPCGLVGRYQRVGGTYCLHFQPFTIDLTSFPSSSKNIATAVLELKVQNYQLPFIFFYHVSKRNKDYDDRRGTPYRETVQL
jgi:hypothetical protein